MTKGLTPRRSTVLRIIVNEYIATAVPVASETLLRSYRLGVSSATIRNDMAYLEEEGFITRPHTSSGSVPLDKGYRYYVESMTENIRLPLEEQRSIINELREGEEHFDKWLRHAALLLARLVGNAAVITFPKANQCHLKHLELVSLHEFLALLILVLSETVVRQQLLSFKNPVNQDQLSNMTRKLNARYYGLSAKEISASGTESTSEERKLTEVIADIMTSEDEKEYSKPCLEGLRFMLQQPEFVNKDRMLNIMELIEEGDYLKPVLYRRSEKEGIRILIGKESEEESLGDLSLVLSGYGIPEKACGTIGVIGPTRMDYRRTISTVEYMSEVLSYLVSGVCHED